MTLSYGYVRVLLINCLILLIITTILTNENICFRHAANFMLDIHYKKLVVLEIERVLPHSIIRHVYYC